MTPQLTPRHIIAATPRPLSAHLTEDEFDELLTHPAPVDGSKSEPAQAHMLSCDRCTAEFVTLRESLCLFRDAASTYADDELRRLPRISLPSRRSVSPALEPAWLVAAAAICLAALLPIQLPRQHSLRPQSTVSAAIADNASEAQSDDALLEDVDRDSSALVPAPMQSLADPTASITSIRTGTSVQSSDQRKD